MIKSLVNNKKKRRSQIMDQNKKKKKTIKNGRIKLNKLKYKREMKSLEREDQLENHGNSL